MEGAADAAPQDLFHVPAWKLQLDRAIFCQAQRDDNPELRTLRSSCLYSGPHKVEMPVSDTEAGLPFNLRKSCRTSPNPELPLLRPPLHHRPSQSPYARSSKPAFGLRQIQRHTVGHGKRPRFLQVSGEHLSGADPRHEEGEAKPLVPLFSGKSGVGEEPGTGAADEHG